jgi:hypothetical protein
MASTRTQVVAPRREVVEAPRAYRLSVAQQDAHVDRWIAGTENGGDFYRWWLHYLGLPVDRRTDETRAQKILDVHWKRLGIGSITVGWSEKTKGMCPRCEQPYQGRCAPCHKEAMKAWRAERRRAERGASAAAKSRFSAPGSRA